LVKVAMEQTIRSIMCKLFADSAEIPGMPNASRVYMRLEPEDWGTLATSASTSMHAAPGKPDDA
jgi:hypothetical protein